MHKSEYGNRIWIKKLNNKDRLESEVQETTAITGTVTSDQSTQTEEDICVSIIEKIKANSKILTDVFTEKKSQLNSKNNENSDCNLFAEQVMGKTNLLKRKEGKIQFQLLSTLHKKIMKELVEPNQIQD